MKKQLRLFSIQIAIVLIPTVASAQLVMNNSTYIVMNGGTQANPTSLVLTNSLPSGITNTGTGWIVSENEFNQVDWNIGTNIGTYMIPFGYGNTDYLPVTCNITAAGVGSGSIKFATYHTTTWDNSIYQPSDVTNMTDFSATNYSIDAVDRFWILDAKGYTTKPTPDIKFSYIRNGASSEIAAPNYIVETDLIAQRFNSTNDEWYDWFGATSTDVTSVNTGTVSTGTVPATGFYRSWGLFNDSTLSTGVTRIENSSSILIYPNPTNSSFTVSGLELGQVIELYNYLGQMLVSSTIDQSTMHFDISTKANGVYLMRVRNKDSSSLIEKKIVKTE
jgi:hypothetical protein